MIISMILAVSKNWCIGQNGKLPWHLSDDLKLFKEKTMGHHILMGRKTFDSLPGILPGRKHLVLTSRELNSDSASVIPVASFKEAVMTANANKETELFIAGGASLYNGFREHVDRIYLSVVDTRIEGDTFIDPIEQGQYEITNEFTFKKGESNDFDFTFLELE